MLFSATDEAKLFAEDFSKNFNLDDPGIYWPAFPSKTNLKMHNIPVTPNLVNKVVTNFDLSKVSGPDCIPVVVLGKCECELLYILAKLFYMFLKESCFPDSWKGTSVVCVFKNMLGRGLQQKNKAVLVFFLWLVKFIKKKW